MTPSIQMTRPFRSGVLVVGDRDDRDLPGCGPDRSIGVGLSSITVPVRYAPATQGSEEPLAVTVSCDYFPDRPSADGFEAVIEVPTGVLVVGDVDASESLTLAPGLWRFFVIADPAGHAERVVIQFTEG